MQRRLTHPVRDLHPLSLRICARRHPHWYVGESDGPIQATDMDRLGDRAHRDGPVERSRDKWGRY